MQCCGCGVEFGDQEGPTHAYMLSSPGCWAAYGQVLAREYEDHAAYSEIHRLTVDTYAAHHPGIDTPQARSSVGFHLSRIYLWLEFGWTVSEIDAVMNEISAKRRAYRWLTPPRTRAAFSVADVLAATTPEAHKEIVRQWARAVWNNWSEHHATVHAWNMDVQRRFSSKTVNYPEAYS